MNNTTVNEIPRIFTPCRDCIFATYKNANNDGELLNIQDGCQLGRLEVYKETTLKEEKDISYYEIEGRVCNTYRNQSWADAQLLVPPDRDINQLIDKVLKDVQFSYDYIINLEDSAKNIELLKRTVDLALHNNIKPQNIIIVKHADSALSSLDIFRHFKNAKEEFGVKVSIESIYDDNNTLNKMNKAVARCDSMYFIWQDGFFPLLTNKFIKTINDYINVKLERFIMLEDKDYMFTVCHKQAFDNVGKNGKLVGFNKIKQLASEQNTEYLIKQFSEI